MQSPLGTSWLSGPTGLGLSNRRASSTRPGYRLLCQQTALQSWSLTHVDLEMAFLQDDELSANRTL
eukprot:10812497-Prorocentrum_lima.AAC.1